VLREAPPSLANVDSLQVLDPRVIGALEDEPAAGRVGSRHAPRPPRSRAQPDARIDRDLEISIATGWKG